MSEERPPILFTYNIINNYTTASILGEVIVKKDPRLVGGIVAIVVVVVVIAIILSGIFQGQAATQQSLAQKMALDSSDLKTVNWVEDTPWFWNLTGKNSHIDYRISGQLWSAHIVLQVWNSSLGANATFHSWIDANSTRTNLTIGEESYINEMYGSSHLSINLFFIRGNVTASIRWDGYVMDANGWNQAYVNVFFYSMAQDLKIIDVQRLLITPTD